MNVKRLNIIRDDLKRCKIEREICIEDFSNWKSLPKQKGCYSIWQGDLCIYVGKAGGKGGFPDRFVHHDAKAFGKNRSGTRHTEGWFYYREKMKDWNPNCWEIEYVEVNKEVHRTYLEGVMLLLFDPLCNDESSNDRMKSL